MTHQLNPKSNCCGAPLSVGGKGTTYYWICTCCGQPCDARSAPQGPTDEELDELWAEIDGGGAIWAWQHYARAVLARWALPVPDSSTTTHCKR